MPSKDNGTPIDAGATQSYYGLMEDRIEKLEANVASIKVDLSVLKASCATKQDLTQLQTEMTIAIETLRAEQKIAIESLRAEYKSTLAEAKNSIIMWIASVIFLGQLLPSILKLL